MSATPALLQVTDLEMRFGKRLIQQGVSLTVEKGCIFAVMGGSGCGKSTLLKHMVGLLPPAAGQVCYRGVDYWASSESARNQLRAGFGMLFQSAALWSSMTLLDNVCLPLELHTTLDAKQREARARQVLEWVGLGEFGGYRPADLSGGMKKRAGLARAIAAEPPLLFLDEPSAGLDPISSKRLDDLVLDLRRSGVREPRVAEPVRDRRRRHLPGRRQQAARRPWQPRPSARSFVSSHRACFPAPRRAGA
jgi:phospholipid/cholesterol/gamma-HCH transport system ATP-binding protein